MEDMIDLSNPLTVRDNINIYDKCRFLKGIVQPVNAKHDNKKEDACFAGPVLLILLGVLTLLIH